jgi:hypothetical protein
MEAVISRMKTVKTAESRATNQKEIFGANMRFLAISATLPNADDVSTVTVFTDVILINFILKLIKLKYTKFANFTCRGIFFAFHNISQPNSAILLTLGCSNAVIMNCTISNFLKSCFKMLFNAVVSCNGFCYFEIVKNFAIGPSFRFR